MQANGHEVHPLERIYRKTQILMTLPSCTLPPFYRPPLIFSRPPPLVPLPLPLDLASIMLLVDTRTEIPHVDDSRDEDEGSIISSLIAQLRSVVHPSPSSSSPGRSFNDRTFCRVGMDLSRVTFPTFVLEPRSMLERITDFMAHPDLIFGSVPPHPQIGSIPLTAPTPSSQRGAGRRPRRAIHSGVTVLPGRVAHQAQRR